MSKRITIDDGTYSKLEEMSIKDSRTVAGTIEWLVEEELANRIVRQYRIEYKAGTARERMDKNE